MTRAAAATFRRGWALVAAMERKLVAAEPASLRLRQLAALMASVRAMGWEEALDAEDSDVRERWVRLRKAILA